ncbi:MAG: HD domain-containing protein [Dehalococcoidia bacterium]|nr:HD domain-containing protein [Dehalococcoidia bacterium]
MPAHPALIAFMEARVAVAERACAVAGLERCHKLSDRLDEALRELAASGDCHGLAVVAVGGSGRREQCRHSDLDVVLLIEGRGPQDAVQRVLYPLWDTGIKVGHAVRTVEQCTSSATQNVETLTALLDARLVAGDEALWTRFVAARAAFARRLHGPLERALAEQHRAAVAAEPWQLQDPDLKRCRGGLRALQALHWLSAAHALAAGTPPPPLDGPLEQARERLLATRNALHAHAERPNDRYRSDLAAPVAAWLGVDRTAWGRGLFAAMRDVDAAACARFPVPAPRPAGGPLRRWFGRSRAPAPVPPRAGREGRGTDLEQLLALLRREQPEGLEPLPPAAWQARLLPEWDAQRSLPHVAPFHRHPVDAHGMRTVHEARRALRVDEEGTLTTATASRLPDEDEVLLAALLHDIGKGHDGDHSRVGAGIAERFAARAGLEAETARRLATVAAQHLLLPNTATRRDIADERVIRETAAAIGDAHTLHLLYVISVADARATGPDVWSPWKAQLMRTLYLRVLNVLDADTLDAAADTRALEQAAVDTLAGRFAADEVRAHLRQLAPGYVLSTAPEAIGEHLQLVREAAGGTALRRDRVGAIDRLTIVTADRPGVLSLVAGTLAAHNASVLGGVAYTRNDGVAIDVMHITDALERGIDAHRWTRIFAAVPAALAGEFPVDERLAETRAAYHAVPRSRIPTEVHVDNVDSEHYSIVEVHAADRLGLLYAITLALHELALDIHLAKVDTIGAEVMDAFYVQRERGGRLESAEEIERVRRGIVDAVAALDESPAAPPPAV